MTPKQEHDQTELIYRTIDDFYKGAKFIQAPDMTALTSALLSSLVVVMTQATDADTSLQVLSRILVDLAPQCKHGQVQILTNPSKGVH